MEHRQIALPNMVDFVDALPTIFVIDVGFVEFFNKFKICLPYSWVKRRPHVNSLIFDAWKAHWFLLVIWLILFTW